MFKKLLLSLLLFWGADTTLYAEKISNYTIDITVEQSGELSIVESIEYDFEKKQKHGMFRDIPFTIKGPITGGETTIIALADLLAEYVKFTNEITCIIMFNHKIVKFSSENQHTPVARLSYIAH